MIVCHVEKGGAYKVAQHYGQSLKQRLFVKPGLKKFIADLKEEDSSNPIIFNAPHHAFKYFWLIKLIRPRSRIYCVEHFIVTQLLKHEFDGFKRVIYLLMLKVNNLLGIVPISLDKYSFTVRKRFLGSSNGLIIHNPSNIGWMTKDLRLNQTTKEYDLIWAAGLSKQKMWPEALEQLCVLAKKSQSIKIAIASYDTPSEEQLELMSANGITFLGNVTDWYSKASTLFFSSIYEGYPLVLLESIANGMNIVAWCHRSCYSQIGKFYDCFSWTSSSVEFCWPELDALKNCGIDEKTSEELVVRHSPENFNKELSQL